MFKCIVNNYLNWKLVSNSNPAFIKNNVMDAGQSLPAPLLKCTQS